MKKKNKKDKQDKKIKLSQIERLEHYEQVGFDAGNACYAAFNETKNLSALKGAISSYRLSMQAIRDQVKFKIGS
jgi:hypothetical protein